MKPSPIKQLSPSLEHALVVSKSSEFFVVLEIDTASELYTTSITAQKLSVNSVCSG